MPLPVNRRGFLHTTSLTAATAAVGYWTSRTARADAADTSSAPAAGASATPIERPVFAVIGLNTRGRDELLPGFAKAGSIGALCDVDALHRGRAVQKALDLGCGFVPHYEDYRAVFERPDIDAVVLATPDHWHAKQLIEAVRAGKDVYCEKPMTLTIDEGRKVCDAVRATGRIVQVGTQQRTEFDQRFAQAVAMVQGGRVGKLKKVTCAIGGSPASTSLPSRPAPSELNWDLWQGPAKAVDYRAADHIETEGYGAGVPYGRTHTHFRWWYEYSGGKLTDWGAHHVDIAMWALKKSGGDVGPYSIDPVKVVHPVEFVDGYPVRDDMFNTAVHFLARVTFADGLVMDVCDSAVEELGFENGVMFQGEGGRFLVNREKIVGKPVEELSQQPLAEDWRTKIYGRPAPSSHIGDFVDCLRTRATPISDVESHHRHLTICHVTAIALRLGRKVTFDPATERFVDDPQADSFLAREYRKGFEIKA